MSDILYPLSVCGPLVIITKRDFHLVAYNETGQELVPLTALDEIGYASPDGINQLTVAKVFPEKLHAPKKRAAQGREMREVQDAQLALELERYLHGVERSFAIDELRPAWYPIRMLADVLRNRAEYELPDIQLVQLAADLVTHADHLMRRNLSASDICLPPATFTANADSPNPAAPAVRLALTYFEQIMDSYTKAHAGLVGSRVEQLNAG